MCPTPHAVWPLARLLGPRGISRCPPRPPSCRKGAKAHMHTLRDNDGRRPCNPAGRSWNAKENQESVATPRSWEEARKALPTR